MYQNIKWNDFRSLWFDTLVVTNSNKAVLLRNETRVLKKSNKNKYNKTKILVILNTNQCKHANEGKPIK